VILVPFTNFWLTYIKLRWQCIVNLLVVYFRPVREGLAAVWRQETWEAEDTDEAENDGTELQRVVCVQCCLWTHPTDGAFHLSNGPRPHWIEWADWPRRRRQQKWSKRDEALERYACKAANSCWKVAHTQRLWLLTEYKHVHSVRLFGGFM